MNHLLAVIGGPWLTNMDNWLAHLHVRELIEAAGILWALFTFVLTRNAAVYANCDSLYQDVLQIGAANGALRNPDSVKGYRTFPPTERAAYESYAYMVFNVCETIADGLDLYPDRRRKLIDLVEAFIRPIVPGLEGVKSLRETWRPVLKAEKDLHGEWLKQQVGGTRFKQEFLDLMKQI